MKRARAAAYCDLSESAFEREVLEGRLPQPVKLGNRDHWCRKALDAALDHITGKGRIGAGGKVITTVTPVRWETIEERDCRLIVGGK